MSILRAKITTSFFLLFALLLSGCQKDDDRIITPPADQVIGPEMATLLQRISLKDGSADNIIDHASCITLVFPLTVTVNGIDVSLKNIDDLGTVEDILDASTDDDDKIKIWFPLTVMLEDFGKVTVQDESDLSDLVKKCVEGGSDDDIECVDFNYPFEIALYKTDSQVADVITIDDDEELYLFLAGLKSEDLVSFMFPVSITLSDGETVSILNNSMLADMIKDVLDDCDEDDDDDHNDDDNIDSETFVNILTSGEWVVTYFFEDDDDETADFEGYTFTFASDGKFSVYKSGEEFEGSWEVRTDNGVAELRFDIDEDDLDALDENWKIMDFSTTKIRLRDSSGGNPTYLTFEQQ